MNKITFPLKPRMQGVAVADLQDGLQLGLDKGVILRANEAARRELAAALHAERAGSSYGEATRKLVSIIQEENRLEASGSVDEATASLLNGVLARLGAFEGGPGGKYQVTGTVRLADGLPGAGIAVAAFDRDLRSATLLGTAQTDRVGSYLIEYVASQFQEREHGSADLVVHALGADGALLAASAVLFNAPAKAQVDLTIAADGMAPPSLFERLGRALAPLLGNVRIEELEEDREHQDISFIAGETGTEKGVIARFIVAHRLAHREIGPEFWFALLGGTFFVFAADRSLRQQLPAIEDGLPSFTRGAVDKALARAFNGNEIAQSLRQNAVAWTEAFLALQARRLLDGQAPSFARSALEHAGIDDAKKQQTFARLYNEHKALTPAMLDVLEKDTSFNRIEIADLRTSFRLAELTHSDFSLVKALKDEFNIRQPEQIRILARQSGDEWVSLVKAKQAGSAIALPAEADELGAQAQLPREEVVGHTLERQFREAFPTSAFGGGLERALHNGGAEGLRHGQALSELLARHPDFELLNTPVDAFLGDGLHPEMLALAEDASFRQELKAVQRVFKLAPSFAATDALLADDVHSAQQVYRIGKSEFTRRYAGRAGFTAASARQAWNRAADTHAAVLTVVADLKALQAEALPLALQNDSAALATFPNWNSLFQAGDMCECAHCRSVLSPAAYFADLLVFLKERKAANPAATVKDVLFARRPDLGFLELNCDNALTPLPYVDVVCEVLENVVAAGADDIELAGLTTIPAAPAAAKAAVGAALTAHHVSLGDDFTLTQVTPGDPTRWVAHGDELTCLLKQKPPSANFFLEVLCNTKASAAELRAYPQYVNPKAYDKLRAAKYPLTLPFDLFAEEVRAGFETTKLARWDLMRTLRGTAAPNNPLDGDIAADYFAISVDPAATFDEKRLILLADATVAGQQALWGESGNPGWLAAVGNVKVFLAKTALEYGELLGMLALEFINPAGDIAITHLDTSCDTDKKVIQVLDEVKLDRIHRFLRLWRKLHGWTMWELDLVLCHARIGNKTLDEPFLVKLFAFCQLKTRLGAKATVEQLCGLFGDLNTATRFTKLHEKGDDGLYQNLFLNKRLIRPLDSAFAVAAVSAPAPTPQKISMHRAVVLATLGIRETDLLLLQGLTRASNGAPYIGDDMTLSNLSFLWRHAWLSRQLKLKSDEWRIVLKMCDQDLFDFPDPQAALAFVEQADQIKASGVKPDELSWLLGADRSAKAALKEADSARFLAALRKQLQAIRAAHDLAQYPFLVSIPPTDVDSLTALVSDILQELHRDDAGTQFFIAILRDDVFQEKQAAGMPASFLDFPDPIKNTMRIAYDKPSATLRFTGLMTTAQRVTLLTDPALAAVAGVAGYQDAIAEFFERPRHALKFYETQFTAPLANLPPTVDFQTLADPELIRKISYDAEQRLLIGTGFLSKEDQLALDSLSADADYRNAVNMLATQPLLGGFPPELIWLEDADLAFPLRDAAVPANDKLTTNLATAITKALAHLATALAENAVVEQASAQLGLSPAITRLLLTRFAVLPATLLTHFTGAFAGTSGVIDYATLKPTFDGWNWANRVATLWKKWQLTLDPLERLIELTGPAKLLDPLSLPLDETGAVPPLARLLRSARLLRLRDSLPESGITLFEVLGKLHSGAYPATVDFAADVEGVNDAWGRQDVAALVASMDPVYPGDYLLAETWDRLRRAFYFLDSLNAGATSVSSFAAPAMTAAHARTLKELLRAKFGAETWLVLSADIQNLLRERKRSALAAYLLSQPQPADAPSGKWNHTNDLYAHYLLDVEMCSCQLTSRLVQASGSVQLFVQRCFMGLEPAVVVKADGDDGDSAWRWWKWMHKYRVWEANRKVFLWPENWIEPELKKDRSPFFKDLENELRQNECNQDTVETAFTTYLEKLDGVAQLEIAGHYQEDDADNTILHVFGRTSGVEPHLYYYRRYDYRQWTPWEKVDLDIQGDYLIPAVVNKRLYLLWPVFTEVPDEAGNNGNVPLPSAGATSAAVKKASKKLRLQMAVSDFRQGKWTPKKISRQFQESAAYNLDIVKRYYRFFPIDRSGVDGRFGVQYDGSSASSDGNTAAYLSGAFEISGCKGVPELTTWLGNFRPVLRPEWESVGGLPAFGKWVEAGQTDEFGFSSSRHDAPSNDFTLENSLSVQGRNVRLTPVLMETPWFFKMSPAWHLSYLDRLFLDGQFAFSKGQTPEMPVPTGSWVPFFYNDKKRSFFVLPAIGGTRGRLEAQAVESVRVYYPEIKKLFRQFEDYFEGLVQTWLDGIDLSTWTSAQHNAVEQIIFVQFPDQAPPAYTDAQLKTLMKRFFMRIFHYWLGALSLQLFESRQFHFKNFYHPFVCDLAKLVYNPLKGIPAMMRRETQLKDSGFSFKQSYQPTSAVVKLPPAYPADIDCYPREVMDFTPDGAYAPYNWELFFHAPLLIANTLSKNQRFAEARDWYHFIFNPIGVESAVPGGTAMSKYWITKPFFETSDPQYIQQRIDNILLMLAGDTSVAGYSAQAKKALEDQVLDWRTNPFEPHRLANYRTVAYQKTVVMKYCDNLIAWGDYLFRQDSMESINEASQLYVLAAEILGPRPKSIPPQAKPPLESFNELEHGLDKFSNALIEVENLMPVLSGVDGGSDDAAPLPMLYFCIPHNEKLLGYWDSVADRLYKIRHCMNIEGVVRQLALFEPPIDPAALVKAVAGGADIGAALADLNAPLPLYRFNVLLQKANEVCNDVKALGSALLAALEKKDAEAIALLRSDHELRLLDAVTAVRAKQIDEAKENLNGIKLSRELATIRKQYYESREFMNAGETVAFALSTASTLLDIPVSIGFITGGALKAIPNFLIGASGFGGSPHASVQTGGGAFGDAAKFAAEGMAQIAKNLDKMASLSSTMGSYTRRQDDWVFQKDLALKEIEQFDRSIASAELRIAIAEKERDNHALQIENAKASDAFMRSKYTNHELYQWQIGQVSGVYFQSYKLAYDLAKRAERGFRFELGVRDSSYINFGYWDSLKKGLLSGEKLQHDLRRLESAYIEQNRREFELSKHVSLELLDPRALTRLRETGRCDFSLPEEIFDLDYPGHYFRRIKSVSMTVPCVAGPYTTVSCTLRLLSNSIRATTMTTGGYPRNVDDNEVPTDDDRFVENNIPVKAVAASNAQNDSGMFELNFRDERYLPFEGAGALSRWSLELFTDDSADFGKPLRQIDYARISDVILHVKYTAREDAGAFKKAAVAHLRDYFSQDGALHSMRMFDLRNEFPTEWHRFLNPVNPLNGNLFELELAAKLFPVRDLDKTLKVNAIWLFARCTDGAVYNVRLMPPLPAPPPAGAGTMALAPVNEYGGLHFAQKDVSALNITLVPTEPAAKWVLKMTRPGGGNLQVDPVKHTMELEDMQIVLGYQWE